MSIISSLQYGILQLTLHRPELRNSISSDMFNTLSERLLRARSDDSVRVILLKGNDRIFSAGADVQETFKNRAEISNASRRFFRILRNFPKPIVAEVHGIAVAEAFAILLYCDFVYVNEEAAFSIPATALARTPRFGFTALLPLATGLPKINEKILLAEPISAQEALDMHLITAIYNEEDLTKVVAAKVARLAVLPTQAIQESKKLLRNMQNHYLNAQLELEEQVFNKQKQTFEAQEALNAFLEGRKPIFVKDE